MDIIFIAVFFVQVVAIAGLLYMVIKLHNKLINLQESLPPRTSVQMGRTDISIGYTTDPDNMYAKVTIPSPKFDPAYSLLFAVERNTGKVHFKVDGRHTDYGPHKCSDTLLVLPAIYDGRTGYKDSTYDWILIDVERFS